MSSEETRDGVALTNLDQPLFEGAGATKRDLVDYLDAVRDRILPALEDRPLSVIRVHRGQEAFMQKNVPRYTPDWVRRVRLWSESSHRDVDYALCDDRRTLIWFANQRASTTRPWSARNDSRARRISSSTSIHQTPMPSSWRPEPPTSCEPPSPMPAWRVR
jgi:DNA primase